MSEYCKECYKKQEEIEQLQAENERLKKEVKQIGSDFIKKGDYARALEQENERLKEEITKLSDPRYQISKVNEGYYNRMNTYKQALQEIREIVSEPCIVDENCQTCNSGCMQKDILTKINEVIGAE